MYGLASVCHQMQADPEREGPPVKQFYAAEADPKELVSACCLLTSPPHLSSKPLLVEKVGDAGSYLLQPIPWTTQIQSSMYIWGSVPIRF